MSNEREILTERQVFRIGILENIAVGMMLAPYITISFAGRLHGFAFILGLLLVIVYGIVFFLFAGRLEKGIENKAGDVINIFYGLRFIFKAAVVLLFFGTVVKEYLLVNTNQWVIIICLVFVCLYGASGDIKKRGRLIELIFWWMLVPIILMAAFSISSINVNDAVEVFDVKKMSQGAGGVAKGGYIMLIAMSELELLLFSMRYQKNNKHVIKKILIWIVLSLSIAYVFIIGIIGREWAGSKGVAAFNVMEASLIPGKMLSRMDYPVLAFWIIGIFAQVSGFIFSSGICIKSLSFIKKSEKLSNCKNAVISGLILLALFLWSYEPAAVWLMRYFYYFDIAVSILIPYMIIIRERVKEKARLVGIGLIIVLCCINLSGCDRRSQGLSLENRDYVLEMEVTILEDDYFFIFEIADLADYKGDKGPSMETFSYECEEKYLMDAIEDYYEERERQLDLGHMQRLVLELNGNDIYAFSELLLEISDIPAISKSTMVVLNGKTNTEINLRQLIKEIYNREESSYAS